MLDNSRDTDIRPMPCVKLLNKILWHSTISIAMQRVATHP
eukprot:COSAG02_NODE_47824_length_338_cov_0.866109_1_plen_39_part_10